MSDKRLTVEDLSPDQREVYENMDDWSQGRWKVGSGMSLDPPLPILTVGGLAGTGKTTLLGVFAANTDLLVAYVTFTGRASSILHRKLKAAGALTTDKMRPPGGRALRGDKAAQLYDSALKSDSGPAFVGTIHRLLYKPVIDSETEELLGWTKRDRLDRDYDLIVIDEASMVGGSMLEDLKRFNVPILAVGDHGQLPPVMDSGELMKNPDLRLEKIHRQAESSPIIRLAHAIRETGEIRRWGENFDGDDRVRFRLKTSLETCIVNAYADQRRENPFSDALLDVGVLCWTNRMRVRLNGMARQALGFRGPPKKDEVVIALRNEPPVYNGMRGVLTADAQPIDGHCMRDPAPVGCCAGPGHCDCECNTCDNPIEGKRPWLIRAPVEFPDEGLPSTGMMLNGAQFNREKTFASLEEIRERGIQVNSMKAAGSLFDFGYALTGHKAQGSQFQHAIIYIDRPVRPDDEDFRKWAYTCVTRASERLTIVL